MSDILMSENQYNMFSLNFADEFKIIKDIIFFKNIILLSIMDKSGLYKIRYFPKKHFKYHYYKSARLLFVSDKLNIVDICPICNITTLNSDGNCKRCTKKLCALFKL